MSKISSLKWDAYSHVGSTLRFMCTHKDLIQVIGSNKRADLVTLTQIPAIRSVYNGSIETVLEILTKEGIIIEHLLPAIYRTRVEDESPFYSVNWKMIKAINKACSTL